MTKRKEPAPAQFARRALFYLRRASLMLPEMNDAEQNWAIYRKTPNADIFLGRVKAQDEERAISVAIEKLDVSNPHHRRALVARKLPG